MGKKLFNKMKWGESHWWIVVLTVTLIAVISVSFVLCDIVEARVLFILLISIIYYAIIETHFTFYINRLTYRVKHEIARHERMISIYTVLIATILIAVYEILRLIGRSSPLFPLLVERKEYYALVISLCSLVVALLLSLKLDIKKIESGEDFLAALRLHAKDLQRKSTSSIMEELHIYSPNINIGVSDIIQRNQKHCTMYNIITECTRVNFIFHCPHYSDNSTEEKIKKLIEMKEGMFNEYIALSQQDGMLGYLWKNYFDVKTSLQGKISDIVLVCITDLNDMLSCKNVKYIQDKEIDEKMVGFRSKYEMVLGQYSDIERNKHTGEVDFHGEVVTIPEFIDFVPKIINWG